jgi:putative iron-dependent peroxidase
MTTTGAPNVSRAIPQPVVAPLTNAAIFLVVTMNPGVAARTAVRSLSADLSALLLARGGHP